jgi:hypothetical protein
MRPLGEIVKANREAEALGVAVPGAVGTKGGEQLVQKKTKLTPARLQQLGLDKY